VLVFEVAGHRYGVEAGLVHEIVRAVRPARLPAAPAVVLGVINVRGTPAPLIDLRARFGLPASPLAPSDVFVLMQLGPRLVAFRADRAHALVKVPRDDIAQLRDAVPRARFAESTVMLPDGVLLICDVARFLDDAEQRTLDGALSALAASEAS
jgi:purine-binding chemotaxis protein CheW